MIEDAGWSCRVCGGSAFYTLPYWCSAAEITEISADQKDGGEQNPNEEIIFRKK